MGRKYSLCKKATITILSMAVFAVTWQRELLTVFAADIIKDGLNYNIIKAPSDTENGKVEVGDNRSYTGSNLSIPAIITVTEGGSNDGTYDVVRIKIGAFYRCSGLTGTLTIPSSVTEIGGRAFCLCPGLSGNLTIPSSVTEIGYQAFYLCQGLNGTLTIPGSLTSVGGSAFGTNSDLTKIDTDISDATILTWAFTSLDTASIPLTCPARAVEGYICLGFTDSNITRRLTISGQSCQHYKDL